MRANVPDTDDGFDAIVTRENLGRYLEGLREKESGGYPPSLPQSFRHRWWRQRGVLVTALVQVAVALTGLGLGYALRGEMGDRPTPPANLTALLVARSVPLIARDTVDLIQQDGRSPGATPAQANQSFTDPAGVDRRDVAGAAAPQLIAALVASPCGIEPAEQSLPALALPSATSPSVISPSVTSPRMILPGVTLPSVVSPGVTSQSVLSPNATSPSVVSPNATSLGVISLCRSRDITGSGLPGVPGNDVLGRDMSGNEAVGRPGPATGPERGSLLQEALLGRPGRHVE